MDRVLGPCLTLRQKKVEAWLERVPRETPLPLGERNMKARLLLWLKEWMEDGNLHTWITASWDKSLKCQVLSEQSFPDKLRKTLLLMTLLQMPALLLWLFVLSRRTLTTMRWC